MVGCTLLALGSSPVCIVLVSGRFDYYCLQITLSKSHSRNAQRKSTGHFHDLFTDVNDQRVDCRKVWVHSQVQEYLDECTFLTEELVVSYRMRRAHFSGDGPCVDCERRWYWKFSQARMYRRYLAACTISSIGTTLHLLKFCVSIANVTGEWMG